MLAALHAQYIKDAKGKKSMVILPAQEFELILEELEELEVIKLYDESKNDNEPTIPKNQAMAMIEA